MEKITSKIQTLSQKWFTSDICWYNAVVKLIVPHGSNFMEIKHDKKSFGENCILLSFTILLTEKLLCLCGSPPHGHFSKNIILITVILSFILFCIQSNSNLISCVSTKLFDVMLQILFPPLLPWLCFYVIHSRELCKCRDSITMDLIILLICHLHRLTLVCT